MNELVEWLRAQLDLDQAHAEKDLWALDRATATGDWQAHYGYNLPFSELRASDGYPIGKLIATRGPGLADGEEDQHAADAFLVARLVRSARSRASRVLREVEALRAIVDLHSPRECNSYSTYTGEARIQCEYCASLCHSHSGLGCEDPVDALYPCDTIRLVAAIFESRPGYQENWRPT